MLLKDKLQQLGISYNTYYKRLICGYSKEEALSIPHRTRKENAIFQGKKKREKYPAEIKNKKLMDRYNYFLKRGFLKEEALKRVLNPRIAELYKGYSKREWAKKLGISRDGFYKRVKKHGWEYAINTPVNKECQKNGRMEKILRLA